MWISGSAWLSSAEYWGVPLNKPGSAWNNKYIAVIEPPAAGPLVKARKWITEGVILPVEKIEKSVLDWLKMVKETKLIQGLFEILREDTGVGRPVLVKAKTYSYYLIPFKNRRLEAIFNAYDGSFEELRLSQQVRRSMIDSREVRTSVVETMRVHRMELIETSTPVLRYDPEVAAYGRFSPVWETQVYVKDQTGNRREIPLLLDREGRSLKGPRGALPPIE